jgi:hypothetical protein
VEESSGVKAGAANDEIKQGANSLEIVFEHRGHVVVTQRSKLHGELTHAGRLLTIRAVSPWEENEVATLVTFVESTFNASITVPFVPDNDRYCGVFARDGTRLFDSRDVIPCEPAQVATRTAVQRSPAASGKRPHPRHLRDHRNK